MKIFRRFVPMSIVAVTFLNSCNSVPITGRRQLSLFPASEIQASSFQQYKQVLNESQLSRDAEKTQLIKKVGSRIQMAVEDYLRANNGASIIEGFQWEFNLIESDQVNAWCMPGGKVAFYTGILPVCQDEAGIAVVMGHEVAHAIAGHGGERMSQQALAQAGQVGLSLATMNESPEMQSIYMTAFGMGAQYGALLPFSRKHESEADEMGLVFMAMAGYDPQQAPLFWQRMSGMGGQKPPEFTSTHPSDARRIADLKRQMSKALKYYKPQ